MSLPLEKLLNANVDRYNSCVAAIRIAQRLATEWGEIPEDEETSRDRPEKLAVVSMRKLLNEEVTTKAPESAIEDQVDIIS